MDEMLTVAQIEAQFQSEWVLIEEPRTNEALEVQSGKVRWHSKDREEVYRKVVERHPRRFAILYTGTMPEDTAIVLCISPSTRVWLDRDSRGGAPLEAVS
jgi:hypothetical protein